MKNLIRIKYKKAITSKLPEGLLDNTKPHDLSLSLVKGLDCVYIFSQGSSIIFPRCGNKIVH